MLRNYIDSLEKLEKLLKKSPIIPDAATAKIAIIRPTENFRIETPDNPDMVHTLELQKAYVNEQLTLVEKNDPTLTEERKQNLVRKFQDEFQKDLSLKAAEQQTNLINQLKINGIMIAPLLEDKTTLPNSGFDYFTDQIFATDTGQYYFDDDKEELCFIPAHFKNEQRKGEERLAIVQAENIGAKIKNLVDERGKPLIFEGGDIRQMPGKKLFFIGQGLRSDSKTAETIARISGYIVVPVVLLQPQFYHLDCCFLPLPNEAAMVYEGEYALDENNQPIIDKNNDWPILIPGTETMDAKSRALIRHIYPSNKLILITKAEALAFGTNAAILQDKDGNFKMFVNGKSDRNLDTIDTLEQEKLRTQTISLSNETIKKIQVVTENKLEILETLFNIMHGSGGSERCTINEAACEKETLTPYQHGKTPASDAILRFERTRRIPTGDLFFTQKKPIPLSKEEPIFTTKIKLK